MIGVRTRFNTDKLEARLREIALAHGLKARVGVLERDADLLYKNGATVADVARWTEHGTVKQPARPYMRRARAEAQAKLRKITRANAEALATGKKTAVEALGEVAAALADHVVDQIDRADQWAEPLADSTIKKKGHDKPLSDTHLLRETQSWEVRNKQGKIVARGRPAR